MMKRIVFFLCSVFAVSNFATAQEILGELSTVATPRTQGVVTNFTFFIDNSNIPDRDRDLGRKLSYEAEIKFWNQLSRCGYGGLFNTGGAARFDDADYAKFGVRASCRIAHSPFSVVVDNWNLAPLAAVPRVDPTSRRVDSFPNALYGGINFQSRNLNLGLKEVEWDYLIQGDAPVFSPFAVSQPYVSQVVWAEFMYRKRGFELTYRPQLFGAHSFTQAEFINEFRLERKLVGPLWFASKGIIAQNWGAPGKMPSPRSIAWGFILRSAPETNKVGSRANTLIPNPSITPASAPISSDQIIIAAILSTSSMKAAAKKLGISQKQLEDDLKNILKKLPPLSSAKPPKNPGAFYYPKLG